MRIDHVPLSRIFDIHSGNFHSTAELDPGDIPLISCGETNNGLVGRYDIPQEKTFERCLTVAYNGSWPLLTKYHPYRFGAKDDVGILFPRSSIREATLLYIAALLTREKWRYSYGRKCYKKKIPHICIPLPMISHSRIDERWIALQFPRQVSSYVPQHTSSSITVGSVTWNRVSLSSLFDIETGDFNSYGGFTAGNCMIISRSAENNGLAGYFTPPNHARLFPRGTITVSTVTGDAFVQMHPFYASDKVVLLKPKNRLKVTTLFFVIFVIKHQKWRYSYGRSCFPRTISLASIDLPVGNDKQPDELAMEKIIRQSSYWNIVGKQFLRRDRA